MKAMKAAGKTSGKTSAKVIKVSMKHAGVKRAEIAMKSGGVKSAKIAMKSSAKKSSKIGMKSAKMARISKTKASVEEHAAGRGPALGTGTVVLSEKEGIKLLQTKGLQNLNVDEKMELFRLKLLKQTDLEQDRPSMVCIWNRFKDARDKVGTQFQDTWNLIDSDKTGKRASLFSWIRNRGFSENMLMETNVVSQRERLRTRKDLLEFHELAATLNLNPLRPSTVKFIEDGVKKGKYIKVPHPELPDETLYLKQKFSQISDHERVRQQSLQQSVDAKPEDVKGFRRLVATPLFQTLSSSSSGGGGGGGKKIKHAEAESEEPDEQDTEEDDDDDNKSTMSKKDSAKSKKSIASYMQKVQTAIATLRGANAQMKTNKSDRQKSIIEVLRADAETTLARLETKRSEFEDMMAKPPNPKRVEATFKSMAEDFNATTMIATTVSTVMKG